MRLPIQTNAKIATIPVERGKFRVISLKSFYKSSLGLLSPSEAPSHSEEVVIYYDRPMFVKKENIIGEGLRSKRVL